MRSRSRRRAATTFSYVVCEDPIFRSSRPFAQQIPCLCHSLGYRPSDGLHRVLSLDNRWPGKGETQDGWIIENPTA